MVEFFSLGSAPLECHKQESHQHHNQHHSVFNKSWNGINGVTSDVAAPWAHASGGLIIYRPVGCTAVGTDIWRGLYNGADGGMTNVQIWRRMRAGAPPPAGDTPPAGPQTRRGPAPTRHLCLFLPRPTGQRPAVRRRRDGSNPVFQLWRATAHRRRWFKRKARKVARKEKKNVWEEKGVFLKPRMEINLERSFRHCKQELMRNS